MRRVLIFGVLGTLLLAGLSIWYLKAHQKRPPPELLSPFANQGSLLPSLAPQQKSYYVYGFAPFWNLQRTTIHPELTHFAYFSLPITEAGELDGITTEGKSVSRTRWESQLLANTVKKLKSTQKFAIVFTQFSNESIQKILSSPSAQAEYRQSVSQLLKTSPYSISSVNLDIEFKGTASPELRQQYVEFVKMTRELLDQHAGKNNIELSVCVFAGSVNRSWFWDIEALNQYVDHFVVMAYDFHRTTSSVAGPVAPIFGGREQWNSDIVTHLKEFVAEVPAEKIILGIPFYGYEWETTSEASGASVFPGTGSTASYSRVQQLLKQSNQRQIQEHWDEAALSPYLTFMENNRAHVIYYEDQRSLSYKLDLVRDLRLGGIAIWALGYESELYEPWDVIHDKLSLPAK